MDVRGISIALGCGVSESASHNPSPRSPTSLTPTIPKSAKCSPVKSARGGETPLSQQEVTAVESWQEFQHRCSLPATVQSTALRGELEEALSLLQKDVMLARMTIVWKHDKGPVRERLPLIRSCARLGRTELVSGLLIHNNLDAELCEEVVLDAIRSDKPGVVRSLLKNGLFEPQRGFLGYALAECGAARSTSCAICLVDDDRCNVQALQQCDHRRFDLPSWSHVRVIEEAIAKAVKAGAEDGVANSAGGQECLQLLAHYAEPHLQDGEWDRILRLAIVIGEEGPICALLRVCPRVLLQAERIQFRSGSRAAATQRTLGYAHLFGLAAEDAP